MLHRELKTPLKVKVSDYNSTFLAVEVLNRRVHVQRKSVEVGVFSQEKKAQERDFTALCNYMKEGCSQV